MVRVYLKQAWELLCQNKLFSGLYVIGTGLAIAATMVMAVVYYVKVAPVYPETNRLHTLYLSGTGFSRGEGENEEQINWSVSYQALQDWFYPVKNAACVSATLADAMTVNSYVQPDDQSGDFKVSVKLADPDFFRIYAFRFLEGSPFTDADLAGGLCKAVVTESLSRRLFGTAEGVVGRSFSLNYVRYRVCGVVRGGSYLTSKSYAQLYVPYSVVPGYKEGKYGIPYCGAFSVTFLVENKEQSDALKAELADIQRRENLAHPAPDWQVDFFGQPYTHVESLFAGYANEGFDYWPTVRYLLLVLAVMLLVPAVNLSGMISTRMESRLAEMGVRKSFGACRSTLLSQVMWENLLLTLLGGLLGLLAAWLVLYVGRDWIFTVLFEDWPEVVSSDVDVQVSGEMLFAPLVFLAALLLCVVLNLLSALLPAWHSLRKPIVDSLNEKR